MKFSCEKLLLQSAVAIASRAVAAKSTIPALEGVLLQATNQLTVSGYNMQTGIRTKVSADVVESGDIVINARLFGDIFRRSLPDDMITFRADENMMVHLTCGDTDINIAGLSAADYPDLPDVEDEHSIVLAHKTLRTMIEGTAFAVSTNESRPIHTGALFDVADGKLTMAAVRRETLDQADGGNFSFVAPGSALNEVKGICSGDEEKKTEITLGKRHILFTAGNTELICRRLEGEFLDYRNAIPRKNPIVVTVDRKALIESVDRVSVVISEKLKSPVRCTFDHGRIFLSAKTGTGSGKDICRCDGDGDGLEIGFNHRYLMEALRHAPSDTVRIELNTSVSPAVIVPVEGEEDFLYMVLPVRLKSGE